MEPVFLQRPGAQDVAQMFWLAPTDMLCWQHLPSFPTGPELTTRCYTPYTFTCFCDCYETALSESSDKRRQLQSANEPLRQDTSTIMGLITCSSVLCRLGCWWRRLQHGYADQCQNTTLPYESACFQHTMPRHSAAQKKRSPHTCPGCQPRLARFQSPGPAGGEGGGARFSTEARSSGRR